MPSGVALPVTQRKRPRPAPSPGSSVAIDLLPARHGCSLLIGYGNPESPEHILVDAGPRGVGKVIRERLMKLPDPNRGLELLVLTHRDSDAIGGALELLQDRIDVPVRDVWYNGARHQANGAEQAEASRETLGAIRRDALSVLLQERNQSWNGAFDGKAVVVDEAVLPVIALRGGMKVTLLSPRPDELGNALARWDQAGRAGDAGLSDEPLGESPPSGDMASSRSTGRELTPETVEALAREPYRADRSVNNGASIAFVAEYQGAAVLVGGDAYAEILVESIRRFLDERSLQRLTLSGMVVPHNGSHRNLSDKLLSLVDCPRYLFSSDGSRFRHPDRQTIARILVDRQRADTGSVLYFNYRSDQTAIWDDDLLKNYFNYETVYPEQDGLGLRNIPL